MSLFALCLGFFMVIIDVMIVTVALPNIATSLSSSISGLQWVVDGYTLMFTCLLLSAGTIGDRLGAKTAFICGLLLFVLTSLGCGLAPSILILTIFRFLQGLAAAFIVPTSVALINASYENKDERTKAISTWAVIGSIAGASGPILGAFITAWFGWRGVFFVNIPIGIVALILTIKYVVSPDRKPGVSFDVGGQIAAIIGLATLAFGLIEAGKLGWLSPLVLAAFILFIISFIAFIIIERHFIYPMLPLQFFKSHPFSATMTIGMIMNIGFYGILFTLPLYFQQVREYSVMMTGLALIPLVALGPLASYTSGKLTILVGAKTPIIIGLTLGALGYLSLLMMGYHTPTYTWLILPFFIIGFSTTLIMPAATMTILHSVPTDRTGIASGAFNASRQLGSLIGVAVFGTIITASTSFVSGMHWSLILASVAYASGAALIFITKKTG
ncbi:MAG: MFS transporter [Gammaproteobacteria bacterium]